MYIPEDPTESIKWLLARGFDLVRAARLVFVRWSMLEGYAQFIEFITSDDPVIETRPGFEPESWRTDARGSGREVETARAIRSDRSPARRLVERQWWWLDRGPYPSGVGRSKNTGRQQRCCE